MSRFTATVTLADDDYTDFLEAVTDRLGYPGSGDREGFLNAYVVTHLREIYIEAKRATAAADAAATAAATAEAVGMSRAR